MNATANVKKLVAGVLLTCIVASTIVAATQMNLDKTWTRTPCPDHAVSQSKKSQPFTTAGSLNAERAGLSVMFFLLPRLEHPLKHKPLEFNQLRSRNQTLDSSKPFTNP